MPTTTTCLRCRARASDFRNQAEAQEKAGVPLAITAQRRETSIGFLLSLIIAFVYFLFIIIADSFKNSPRAHPELLVWIPNVLFIGLGTYMFYKLSRR